MHCHCKWNWGFVNKKKRQWILVGIEVSFKGYIKPGPLSIPLLPYGQLSFSLSFPVTHGSVLFREGRCPWSCTSVTWSGLPRYTDTSLRVHKSPVHGHYRGWTWTSMFPLNTQEPLKGQKYRWYKRKQEMELQRGKKAFNVFSCLRLHNLQGFSIRADSCKSLDALNLCSPKK